jgi:hypothetical protein
MAVRPSTEKTVPGDDMFSAPTGCCLPRQVSVAHSWPKRRLDDPLNHAVRRTPEGGKYLQMRPFRGVRRQSSVSLTRPVTPEGRGFESRRSPSLEVPASKPLLPFQAHATRPPCGPLLGLNACWPSDLHGLPRGFRTEALRARFTMTLPVPRKGRGAASAAPLEPRSTAF